MGIGAYKQRIPEPDQALPGRTTSMAVINRHHVLGRPILPPYPAGLQQVQFGMGCFWGAERKFWSTPGVHTTAVGYAGGVTPNPNYREVCSGETGHAEVVRVVFDPAAVTLEALLRVFWEGHDPTQGMRQGNDMGTQYRSAIYCADASQLAVVLASRDAFQAALSARGFGTITTEIRSPEPPFFFAEDDHQQYLSKHPGGYCGLGGTGVSCPTAVTGA